MGRINRFVAILEKGARQQIEQIIGAGAADDPIGIEPEGSADRVTQGRGGAVRIIFQVFARRPIGGSSVRARPQRSPPR